MKKLTLVLASILLAYNVSATETTRCVSYDNDGNCTQYSSAEETEKTTETTSADEEVETTSDDSASDI